MKTFYRRHLPHIQPPGATLFVTYRLQGSLPRAVIEQLRREYDRLKQAMQAKAKPELPEQETTEFYRQQKRLIARFDRYLHQNTTGPQFLKDPRVAQLVCDAMKYWDQQRYDLLCYCVMSNHVHMVFTPLCIRRGEYYPLAKILHSIKSYTASQANKLLHRQGKKFWEDESFDHYCRDPDEVDRVINYVLNNPVDAELVASPREWPWSYCKYW